MAAVVLMVVGGGALSVRRQPRRTGGTRSLELVLPALAGLFAGNGLTRL